MSAAKMVADSTQSDEPATKKNKITVKKNKKAKRTSEKKSSRKKGTKEGLTDPNLDLSKDIRPIGDYWQNPAEMLEQMFKSVQGPSLAMILPEILNNMDIKELKSLCLEHLEVMSKKRIFRILAGDELDDISSSDTEDEADNGGECDGMQAADSTSNSQTDLNKDLVKDTISDSFNEQNLTDKDVESKPRDDSPRTGEDDGPIALDRDKTLLELDTRSSDEEDKLTLENSFSNQQTDSIDCENDEDLEEGECRDTIKNESDSGSLIPMLTQNHMELLELEMRARAIKAMLKAQETHSSERT